jgi:hypothetical protein
MVLVEEVFDHTRLTSCFLKSTVWSPCVSQKSTSDLVFTGGCGVGSPPPEPFLPQPAPRSEKQRVVIKSKILIPECLRYSDAIIYQAKRKRKPAVLKHGEVVCAACDIN